MSQSKCECHSSSVPALCNVLTPFTCRICLSIWIEPVTISCGHTFCRRCVTRCDMHRCHTCLFPISREQRAALKTSFLLADIVQKWLPSGAVLRERSVTANRLLTEGRFAEAAEIYTTVLLATEEADNVELRCSRADAYVGLGNFTAALEDADFIVRHRPDWAPGFEQRAVALRGLGRHEEAASAYLRCLEIEPDRQSACNDFIKISADQASSSLSSSVTHCTDSSSSDYSETPTTAIQPKESDDSAISSRSSVSDSATGLSQSSVTNVTQLDVNRELLNAEDLECTLCSRLLFHPLMTPCGHVFCRECLYRSLDYRSDCPLCKESLREFLAERRTATVDALNQIIVTYFSAALEQRRRQHEEEIEEYTRTLELLSHDVPIFVCTMAYPLVPCPLHVFEPRYRLMIRRCVESGRRQFGMCACFDRHEDNFAEYGTMLIIRDVQYYEDGRSIVDTVGGRRFRVLSRCQRDGYHTAHVQFLSDLDAATINPDQPTAGRPGAGVTAHGMSNEVVRLCEEVYTEAHSWFSSLRPSQRTRLQEHYGEFPANSFTSREDGPQWIWYTMAILPLDPHAQFEMLSMTSLQERLVKLRRWLALTRNSRLPL